METVRYFYGGRMLFMCIPYLMLLNYCVSGSLIKVDENSSWMTRDTRAKARLCLLLYGTCFPAMTLSAWFSCDAWYSSWADIYLCIMDAITVILTAASVFIKVQKRNDRYHIKTLAMLVPLAFIIIGYFAFWDSL